MPLVSLLRDSHQRWPEKTAIWFADRGWKFDELDRVSDRIAASLTKAGARPGDRIALFTPNCIELVQCYFGVFKLGAIAVPLNDRYQAEEVRYGIEHCGATILVVHEELMDRIKDLPLAEIGIKRAFVFGGKVALPFRSFEELLDESSGRPPATMIADTDPAVIFYTSGSTAQPKGVTHTHRSLANCIDIQIRTFEFTENDVHMVVTAACHVAAFATQLLPSLASGGTSVLAHLPPPAKFVAAIERYGVTRGQMLPAGLEDIVEYLEQHPSSKLQTWRACTAGGDVVPIELQKRFRKVTGFELTELYGQTEAASTFTNPVFGPKRPGSFGKPVVQTQGRVVDAEGKEVPEGEVGELKQKRRRYARLLERPGSHGGANSRRLVRQWRLGAARFRRKLLVRRPQERNHYSWRLKHFTDGSRTRHRCSSGGALELRGRQARCTFRANCGSVRRISQRRDYAAER